MKYVVTAMPDDVLEVAACQSRSGSVAAHDQAVAVENDDRASHRVEGLAPLGDDRFEPRRCFPLVGDVLVIAGQRDRFASLVALSCDLAEKDVLTTVSVHDAELDR